MDASTLERALRTYRPKEAMTWPSNFVWPRYEGLSVGNLAATISHALGAVVPEEVLPPLQNVLLDGMLNGVRRVVVLVIDALGWEQLQAAMARNPDLPFHRFAAHGRLWPLTTTFPSTTNSVLTTIWTGRPPVAHGLLAFTMYMREWLMAVESISFSAVHEPFAGTLSRWAFDPEAFLPVPTLSQWLAAQGILSYLVIHKSISQTPLSRMQFQGTREVVSFHIFSEFWVTLRRVLHEHRDERMILAGYWGGVDTLAHHYGPHDETGDAEIRTVAMMMEQFFLKELLPEDREGTLLLLTADHGQITTPPATAVMLDDHPTLRDGLFMAPLGESRVPFLYTRHGHYDKVWAYVTDQLGDRFVWLTQDEVIGSGLIGPGPVFKEVPHRLGDIVGLAKDNTFLAVSEEDRTRLLGRHGGLHASEMLVPLLAMRLDG